MLFKKKFIGTDNFYAFISFSVNVMYCKDYSIALYKKKSIISAVFDLTNKYLATSALPEIWQDHQISRTGGSMVHCLETSISSPEYTHTHTIVTVQQWLGLMLSVDYYLSISYLGQLAVF